LRLFFEFFFFFKYIYIWAWNCWILWKFNYLCFQCSPALGSLGNAGKNSKVTSENFHAAQSFLLLFHPSLSRNGCSKEKKEVTQVWGEGLHFEILSTLERYRL
jgi:hypothetical protein